MAQERRLSRLAVISDKLERLLSASSIENMEQILRDYQADGLQKSVLDHPIRRHGGRTAVHLVASKGQSNCLELLLKYGGEYKTSAGIVASYNIISIHRMTNTVELIMIECSCRMGHKKSK